MVGLDICSVTSIRRICQRHGDRFTARVFTPGELAMASRMRDPYPHLAARWAAKEAVLKVLGRVPGFAFTDVEIVRGDSGKPALALHGATRAEAIRCGLSRWHVSLTHEHDTSACVVLAGRGSTDP